MHFLCASKTEGTSLSKFHLLIDISKFKNQIGQQIKYFNSSFLVQDQNSKVIDNKKIKDEILNLKKTLMNLNFQKSSGQLEKTSQIKTSKKQIARLKTKLREKINA